MRGKVKFLVVFIGMLVSTTAIANSTEYWIDAYDLKTGKLVYKERHLENFKANTPIRYDIDYYRPNGSHFAKKTVSFNGRRYDPDILLKFDGLSYFELSRYLGNRTYQLVLRDMGKSKSQRKNVKPKGLVVVDHGIDILIKDKFDDLLNNKTLRFKYIAPARLDYYSFRITPISAKNGILTASIQSDVGLVRWITKPITVEYDIQKRRMISYSGVTNIPIDAKNNYRAKLVVRY